MALQRGLEAFASGRYGLFDGLLLATVERAGCRVLLSEDMADGRKFGAVTILNPFAGNKLPDKVERLLTYR
ncbi:MAG: PIN domain-containing protein [Alphaproteobacteria bacterium]|nr:PIN domain-containing protein [Alphaproteobacteria bacterium]